MKKTKGASHPEKFEVRALDAHRIYIYPFKLARAPLFVWLFELVRAHLFVFLFK